MAPNRTGHPPFLTKQQTRKHHFVVCTSPLFLYFRGPVHYLVLNINDTIISIIYNLKHRMHDHSNKTLRMPAGSGNLDLD